MTDTGILRDTQSTVTIITGNQQYDTSLYISATFVAPVMAYFAFVTSYTGHHFIQDVLNFILFSGSCNIINTNKCIYSKVK